MKLKAAGEASGVYFAPARYTAKIAVLQPGGRVTVYARSNILCRWPDVVHYAERATSERIGLPADYPDLAISAVPALFRRANFWCRGMAFVPALISALMADGYWLNISPATVEPEVIVTWSGTADAGQRPCIRPGVKGGWNQPRHSNN